MPKSRKANFRSKRAQTKKRGKRMGGKRTRKMGRRLQKGGIWGFHEKDKDHKTDLGISLYERDMEAYMKKQFGIEEDSMDWWDITCIDLRKNMKYIYEYHELKKKNGGDFSQKWLNYYKDKLSDIKPFDLTIPLGVSDANTCGYRQKCVDTTLDKLTKLSEELNSALSQIKSELKNKSAESDCTMTSEEEKIQKEANTLLVEIKFCISIKEWIQIRAKAEKTKTKRDWREACANYTTKMKQYIQTIRTKANDLYKKYRDLLHQSEGVNQECKIITDTINLIELKHNDLAYFTRGDDELSDKFSIISKIKNACEEILKESNYLNLEENNNEGYMMISPSSSSGKDEYFIPGSLPGDSGYVGAEDSDQGYMTAYQQQSPNYLTIEDSNNSGSMSAYPKDPGYMVVRGDKNRKPAPSNDEYISMGDPLALDTGYAELAAYKDEKPAYMTAVSEDEDEAEAEAGGGRKYKKKTRSKFRRGKKRLTRK